MLKYLWLLSWIASVLFITPAWAEEKIQPFQASDALAALDDLGDGESFLAQPDWTNNTGSVSVIAVRDKILSARS